MTALNTSTAKETFVQKSPTILALFADADDEYVWERELAEISNLIRLRGSESLSRALPALKSRGLEPGLALISTRVYPLGAANPLFLLRRLFPAIQAILLSEADAPLPSLHPLMTDAIRHLVIEPAGEMSGSPAGNPLKLAVFNLLNDRSWQMNDYLRPGTTVREFAVTSSDQKETLIGDLMAMIGGEGPELELLRQKGALLADEMLENAIYGAPRGEDGNKMFNKGERRHLLPAEEIGFRAGFDGVTLALEVTDSWGSLPSDTVMEHLTCNQDGEGPAGETGGRGLFIIWRFLDQMHVTIAPGRQTVVGGQVRLQSDLDPSAPKGFHIITRRQERAAMNNAQ